MIADAIGDARRQLHFDMPGRSLRWMDTCLVLQFAVFQHLHRYGAALCQNGVDRRLSHRFDRIERLVLGGAGEIPANPELLVGNLRRRAKPLLELAVEIASRIAFTALIDGARAMRRQPLVDEARY